MKFLALFAFALIAAASADVSHLNQYLPPAAPAPAQAFEAAPAQAIQAAPAPAPAVHHEHHHEHQPAAASFSEQDGYNYQTPN